MGKFYDLTGQRFNKLVVLRKSGSNKYGILWLCRCDCGKIKEFGSIGLRNGKTKSCSCLTRELISIRSLKDLNGQRFGRLLVIERSETINKRTRWKCQCDCGNQKIVEAGNLKNGNISSCGCLRRETTIKRKTIHGGKGTRLYHIWNHMRQRCVNPNNRQFIDYGGRGIAICSEWNEFENFRNWAINNGYEDNLTIDRKNNDGNYEPNNCRWANDKQQANNKRNNHFVEYQGQRKTIAEWADICKLKPPTLLRRLSNKWSIEKALSTPV
jgi:hypothetical protein